MDFKAVQPKITQMARLRFESPPAIPYSEAPVAGAYGRHDGNLADNSGIYRTTRQILSGVA